jgi:hypothetical protein
MRYGRHCLDAVKNITSNKSGMYFRNMLLPNWQTASLTVVRALFEKSIQIHNFILTFQDELYVIIGNLNIQRVRFCVVVKISRFHVKIVIALFYQND